jgi:TAG lipase/lysophosphatidylethanolamine acyltransferase
MLQGLWNLLTSKGEERKLLTALKNATSYEEWWDAAVAFDEMREPYDWRMNPIDKYYDHRHLEERRNEMARLRRNGNPIALASYLRHGLMRDLFNVTKLKLYNKTYAFTKSSIQAYIAESVDAVRYIADSPVAPHSGTGRFTAQEKLDLLHDSKGTYGSTALLLQGGSIFGLCHLGVVKALHEHHILPRVIVGTATGALIAALVCIRTSEELPHFLNGDSIDLSAFAEAAQKKRDKLEADFAEYNREPPKTRLHSWFDILQRRAHRLFRQGFLLDPAVLEESIRANVGDITFVEAYERTGRILNIEISPPNEEIPSLLNYLTAPNMLIRSAAMASHITNIESFSELSIDFLYKEKDGKIRALEIGPLGTGEGHRRPPSVTARRTPLARLKQQFNIDHFIVSQARPYVAPFVSPSLPYERRNKPAFTRLVRWPLHLARFDLASALKQGLLMTEIMGFLPDGLKRVLNDETIQGDFLKLVPEVQVFDWWRLLKNPSKEEVDFWIMRGERSVWPSLCALKVRCAIEVALDQAYERARRRRPDDDGSLAISQDGRPLMTPALRLNSGPLQDGDLFNEDDGRRRKAPKLLTEGHEEIEQVAREETFD